MAGRCAHCGKAFSCGCQKTTDKKGRTVCKTCLSAANASNNKVETAYSK